MELRRYLRILRRGWPIIVLAMTAGAMLAAAYLAVTPRTYTSSTSLLVSTGGPRSGEELQQAAIFTAAAALTYAQIVDSQAVLSEVGIQLRPPRSAEQLGRQVSTSVRKSTVIVEVTVTGENPVDVAVIADATAANAVRIVPQLQLTPDGTPLVRLTTLRNAETPVEAAGPFAARVYTIGLVLGLCVGVAASIVTNRFDNRIRRPEDVGLATSLPVIAALPRPGPAGPGAAGLVVRDDPCSATAEGCRRIRAVLSHGHPERSGAVAVCPVTRRIGESCLSLEIAWTLADAGRKVVLIDLDPEDPIVERSLGTPSAAGLAELLAERAKPADFLVPTDHAKLRVIPSGTPDRRRTVATHTRRFADVVAQLKRDHDHVVLHVPPILNSSEAIHTAAIAGSYIVTPVARRTLLSDLDDALNRLRCTAAAPLGIVLTDVSSGYRLGAPSAIKNSPYEPPRAATPVKT